MTDTASVMGGRAASWAWLKPWLDRIRRPGMPLDRGPMDRWLLLVTVVLVLFGLLMVYSASAVVASEDMGDALYFVKRQVVAMLAGVVGLVVISQTPVRLFGRYSLAFYVAALVALLLVFVPGLAYSANGATRWIRFGSFHLQPSEFAKLAMVVTLAEWISRHPGRMGDLRKGVIPAVALAVPTITLVMLEPDFGTSAILMGIVFVVLFLAGLPFKWIAGLGVVGIGAAVPMIALSGYRLTRLRSWLDPWAVAEDNGYQVIQSWVALYSGGWTGVGLGNSLAKLRFLPEPWTDFVAAVVGEELGFLGLLFLLGCYALFLWRGVVITRSAASYFGMLVAGCVTTVLALQAMLNLAVVLGAVPPKGLVLPFVSYGGSAIIAHLWAVGLLLSVSAERKRPRESAANVVLPIQRAHP